MRSSSTTRAADPSTIGILGGTFDPIHTGHLAAADALREAARLQAVWLMPNAQPPHRPAPVASAADRLAMVEQGIAGHPGLHASDLEIRRGGISYTVDTAVELARRVPGQRFAWLIGSDEARAIRTWRDPGLLMRAIDFVAFNRPGVAIVWDELLALGFDPFRTELVTIHTPSIAANDIREAVRTRRPIDGLVPPPVGAYIEARGLYR